MGGGCDGDFAGWKAAGFDGDGSADSGVGDRHREAEAAIEGSADAPARARLFAGWEAAGERGGSSRSVVGRRNWDAEANTPGAERLDLCPGVFGRWEEDRQWEL